MLLEASYEALLTGRWITDLANTAAYLFHKLPQLNWVGFYLLGSQPSENQNTLYLGPFQGKVACTEIPLGKGVCGAAAKERRTILVPNVHLFPGHIACDSASNSEIVVPLITPEGKLLGVLDLDSPDLNRFTASDQTFLEETVRILLGRFT